MEIIAFDAPEVQITSVYFKNDPAHRVMETYPKRMLLDGQEYEFLESGMRYLIQKGKQLVRLFDVSDGQTEYRLRQEGENHWTLVAMKTGAAV